jgi:hypothetical protein
MNCHPGLRAKIKTVVVTKKTGQTLYADIFGQASFTPP